MLLFPSGFFILRKNCTKTLLPRESDLIHLALVVYEKERNPRKQTFKFYASVIK